MSGDEKALHQSLSEEDGGVLIPHKQLDGRKRPFTQDISSSKAPKSKKRKTKRKQAIDDAFDLTYSVNTAISKMDNRLLADYFTRRTKRFNPDLSFLESQDRQVPGTKL